MDEEMILQFASQLDGGQRTKHVEKKSKKLRGGGGLGLKGIGLERSQETGQDSELEFTDNTSTALDRLLNAGLQRPDDLSWIEINDPSTDLEGVSRGFTVHGEAEFRVPTFSRLLGSKGQLQGLTQMTQMMTSLAPLMGQESPISSPDIAKIQGFSALADSLGSQVTAVAEFPGSDWTVAGGLKGDVDIEDLDGPLLFVGKVVEVLSEGEHKSLLTLPGMSVMSREQRRKMEKGPKEGQEDNWVSGPALILKFLAIYR